MESSGQINTILKKANIEYTAWKCCHALLEHLDKHRTFRKCMALSTLHLHQIVR